jgi:hypothetical protein
MLKTYKKTATVQAKIFEKGDEDGFSHRGGMSDVLENIGLGVTAKAGMSPYIKTLENNQHFGEFGNSYICTGINSERWLVEKSIFEKTYEEVVPKEVEQAQKYITRCNDDIGFMGSPEYDKQKKIVNAFYDPIKEKQKVEKEMEDYLRLKSKYEGVS